MNENNEVCLKCDTEMKTEQREYELLYADERFTVMGPTEVCPKCGITSVTFDHYGELGTAVADAYREKHKLLTSGEIRKLRSRVRMTQEAFANYLGVGVASLKRWETGRAQDASSDQLIRVKTDAAMAEQNLRDVMLKQGGPADEFSGERPFDLERFGNVVLFFLERAAELKEKTVLGPLQINKLCWYADWANYVAAGESLTGTRYAALPFGPVPDQYRSVYRALADAGFAQAVTNDRLEARSHFKDRVFTAEERQVLEQVWDERKDRLKILVSDSHDGKAWKDTPHAELISYKLQ